MVSCAATFSTWSLSSLTDDNTTVNIMAQNLTDQGTYLLLKPPYNVLFYSADN